MKLLKKLLIIIIIVAGFFWVKTYQPSIKVVYPNQCSFLIDEQFSQQFQQQLQDYVSRKYQELRDPDVILDDIAAQFVEVASMDAYICKVDKMCFTFNAAQPVFRLNDDLVDDQLHVMRKQYYRDDLVNSLYKVAASNASSLKEIMYFVTRIPLSLRDNFDITWHSDTEILFQSRQSKKDSLLFSLKNIPTVDDIDVFKDLQKKISKKKVKSNVFDFRFNNQVIVK